jgi:choline kinase
MTRVLILAAGEGTRLRPLTEQLPKTLVPLDGVPLLARQLAVLRRAGIHDISVVGGHCADALVPLGLRLFHNPAFASTNMVASLHCARALFDGGDDVVVAYGDIVYEPRVLAALLASVAPVSVVVDRGWLSLWTLRMDEPLDDAESLKLDAQGCITELGRKPRNMADIEAQYIGLFKVDRAFAPAFFTPYEQLAPAAKVAGRTRDRLYMTDYLQLLIDQGTTVRAAPVRHGWLELDSTQDLARYQRALAAGELAPLYNPAA